MANDFMMLSNQTPLEALTSAVRNSQLRKRRIPVVMGIGYGNAIVFLTIENVMVFFF